MSVTFWNEATTSLGYIYPNFVCRLRVMTEHLRFATQRVHDWRPNRYQRGVRRSFKLPLSLVSSESWLLAFTASASECLFFRKFVNFITRETQKKRDFWIPCARIASRGFSMIYDKCMVFILHSSDSVLVEFSKWKWIMERWVYTYIIYFLA